jgi:hypothetical protein
METGKKRWKKEREREREERRREEGKRENESLFFVPFLSFLTAFFHLFSSAFGIYVSQWRV